MKTIFVFLIFILFTAVAGKQACSQNKIFKKQAFEISVNREHSDNMDLIYTSSKNDFKAACDTLNLALYKSVWTIVEYSVSATPPYSQGFVNGVNSYNDKAKANYFPNSSGNTYILGGLIAFSRAYSTNPAKTITVNVYQSSGGSPGAVLASKTFTMQEIMNDVSGNYFTNVIFDNPVAINGQPFFMGVDFSNLNWGTAHDTLSLQSNQHPQTNPSTTWEKQSNNTWYRYTTSGSWNLNIALAIFPVMANVPADAIFTQSATNTCTGYPVTLDGSASAATMYYWNLQGATPSSSNLASLTVTYASAGTFPIKLYIRGGSCNNLDSMISSINIIPSPVPAATATPNAICTGSSSTLSASNGIFYEWSGFPPGPVPSVTVYPTATSSYTVTVTGANGCTASQKVTVTVYPLPDPMASADPDTICFQGGSSLISAAPGMQSYLWSPGGATTAAFVANPSTTTVYTVTVVDAHSCTNTDTVRLVVINCAGFEEPQEKDNDITIHSYTKHDDFFLVFNSARESEIYLELYNITGVLVYREKFTLLPGKTIKQMDISDLACSAYLFRVSNAGKILTRKVLIH